MTSELSIDAPAPDFELIDDKGSHVRLSDYRGTPVIVYFYPKAETPGCTTEACDFRDSLTALHTAGFSVLGISPDDPETLAAFRENHTLGFKLVSDPGSDVAKSWGAWGEKTVNDQTFDGVLRSTLVLDSAGIVEQAHYNVAAEGHVAALRDQLGIP
ncbi:thioredoxin-dependent thiol peroxidase [Salinisphaera sp. USBA-960]|nr:thioredoxin-dependent thiol peroxidase [Salifodinibacter halophilus]NNC26518.1 thioredoxin-dependent thiol peroxidase [Salifodinibacter halophilus]